MDLGEIRLIGRDRCDLVRITVLRLSFKLRTVLKIGIGMRLADGAWWQAPALTVTCRPHERVVVAAAGLQAAQAYLADLPRPVLCRVRTAHLVVFHPCMAG